MTSQRPGLISTTPKLRVSGHPDYSTPNPTIAMKHASEPTFLEFQRERESLIIAANDVVRAEDLAPPSHECEVLLTTFHGLTRNLANAYQEKENFIRRCQFLRLRLLNSFKKVKELASRITAIFGTKLFGVFLHVYVRKLWCMLTLLNGACGCCKSTLNIILPWYMEVTEPLRLTVSIPIAEVS